MFDACRNDPFTKAICVCGLAKAEPIGLFVFYAIGAGKVASDGRAGEIKKKPIDYTLTNAIEMISKEILVPKIDISSALNGHISINSASNRIKDSSLETFLDIQNHTTQKLTVNYRVKYFDEDGMEVGGGMSIWQTLFLEADDTTKIKNIASVPTAKRCKIYFK